MIKKAWPYIMVGLIAIVGTKFFDGQWMTYNSELDEKIKPLKQTIKLQQHKIRAYELLDQIEDTALFDIAERQDSVVNGIRIADAFEFLDIANRLADRLAKGDNNGD